MVKHNALTYFLKLSRAIFLGVFYNCTQQQRKEKIKPITHLIKHGRPSLFMFVGEYNDACCQRENGQHITNTVNIKRIHISVTYSH